MGSAITLWMTVDGTVFNRQMSAISPPTRPNISPPLTVALGTLFSYLIPCVGNLIWNAEKSADMAAEETGDRIELMIRESIKRGEFVEISL